MSRGNVDIAKSPAEQCPSVSPHSKRCCYAIGHQDRNRPGYHCDAHGHEDGCDCDRCRGPICPGCGERMGHEESVAGECESCATWLGAKQDMRDMAREGR